MAAENMQEKPRPVVGESPKCANSNKGLYNAIPWVGNKISKYLKLSSWAVAIDNLIDLCYYE